MTDPQVPAPRSTTDEVVEAVIQKAADKVAEATNVSNGHSALGRSEALAVIAALILLNLASLFLAVEGRSQRNDIQQDVRALCRVTSSLIQPQIQNTTDPVAQRQQVNLLAILTECLD